MKVFISSTYKDLIDYRAAAIRAVEGTNYQASKMEVFGARPDEPLDACLKEVEESELFIGIYALRYGFIPEGADISITEMEYLHAKKLGKTDLLLSARRRKPALAEKMDRRRTWQIQTGRLQTADSKTSTSAIISPHPTI